jgi:hypothetical protein
MMLQHHTLWGWDMLAAAGALPPRGRATQAHPATPTAGVRLRRTASGGYQTIRLDPENSRRRVSE